MSPLLPEEVIKFLRGKNKPLPNSAYGPGHRASVTLTDGVFLPCVIFRNPDSVTGLAIRKFNDGQSVKSIFGKSSGPGYRVIVMSSVVSGNCINY